MTDTLARLIQYPATPVFDDSPRPALALRVRHSAGLVIEVADASLRLTSDAVAREYALDDYTIAELADALSDDGFDVVFESVEYGHRSARSLLAKSSSQDDVNGDHLHVYTSLLWGLFDTYGVQLDHAEDEVGEALRQMVFTQAEGFWLDVWAGLYGGPRSDGETDAALQARLPEEVFRLRNNPRAIEQAILSLTGKSVEIREPWERMFALDSSSLSGRDALHDDDYYTYHVIQPVSRSGIDWSDVLDVINRNRPAGVAVYSPTVELPVAHAEADASEYVVASCIDILTTCGAWPGGETPLGVMRLDDNYIVKNHLAMVFQVRTFSNADGLPVVVASISGARRNVPMASIELSGVVALGEENAIFCRGDESAIVQPPATLSSELALSDSVRVVEARIVDIVTLDSIASLVEFPSSAVEVGATKSGEQRFLMSAERYAPVTWTGNWDDRKWAGEYVFMGMATSSVRAAPGKLLNVNFWLDTSVIA